MSDSSSLCSFSAFHTKQPEVFMDAFYLLDRDSFDGNSKESEVVRDSARFQTISRILVLGPISLMRD
jgi:hypothetical protein